jgi:predicted phosphodiesterase
MDGLRIVLISDTHGYEDKMSAIPNGDVLIHCGDFTKYGTLPEIQKFKTWFNSFPHQHKVFVAGNHECSLETDRYVKFTSKSYHGKFFDNPDFDPQRYSVECNTVAKSQHSVYLQDSLYTINTDFPPQHFTNETPLSVDSDLSVTTDITIYGSPWQPEFRGGAFGLPRGQPLKDVWNLIPSGVDILVTHSPPQGLLDCSKGGVHCGCEELNQQVQQRIKPRIHVFGHIHEARGELNSDVHICHAIHKVSNRNPVQVW